MTTATELTQEESEIVEHFVRHFSTSRQSTSLYGTGIDVKPEQMQLFYDELIRRGVLHRCSTCHGVAVSTRPFKSCFQCDPKKAEADYDDFDEEDDYLSTTEVYNRARRHFGNDELAREAASLYPGDFM